MVLAEAARDTEAAAAQNEVAGLGGRLETMIEAYGRGDISWGEYMAGSQDRDRTHSTTPGPR